MTKQRHLYAILGCGLILALQIVGQQNTAEPVPPKEAADDTTTEKVTKEVPTSTELVKPTTIADEPNTTVETQSPTSPKEKPTTVVTEHTTDKATVTTDEPSTTVEHSTDESTTAEPATTTVAPEPPEGTWVAKYDNGTECLRMQMNATFNNLNDSAEVKLFPNATINTASCSAEDNTEQTLELSWDNYLLNYVFKLTKDGKKFYLDSLTLTNITSKKNYFLNGSSTDLLTAHTGKSFECKSNSKNKMEPEMSVTWSDVRVQAFKNHEEKDYGSAEDCAADNTSDIVPIAVGCALAGLVIVVLIAYLIGRRRSRQKGYQSV